LRSLAEGGAIVVFNVSDIRSDAFIITTNAIQSVNLSLLTSGSIKDYAKRFINAINERHLSRLSHARDEMNVILEWLWNAAVEPVLNKLGFTHEPSDNMNWPRVWWVGSGLLRILPIHAAGYHDSSPPRTALDRVISSYAPTVKSLSYSRERYAHGNSPGVMLKEKALLVSMPTTPEQNSLQFVKTEIENLKMLFSKLSVNATVLENSTRTKVLSELSECTLVHFACHGNTAIDPSKSCLLLEDWRATPLTVSDLLSLNIKLAKIAYLSACRTSAMQDFDLLDESITLASAIQLSGYPIVIASLWQIMDQQSAGVARHVYEWIIKDSELKAQYSAEGLHLAVRILREETRKNLKSRKCDPLIWAPYIHIGI
jgi:CHAT domain-containing protein